MSNKPKEDRTYTVDEILAEYDRSGNRGSGSSASDESGNGKSKPGFSAVPSYDEKSAGGPEFSEPTAIELPDNSIVIPKERMIDVDIENAENITLWEDENGNIGADIDNDVPDDALFTDEIIEEPVSPDEISDTEDENCDEIFDDDDDEGESTPGEASDDIESDDDNSGDRAELTESDGETEEITEDTVSDNAEKNEASDSVKKSFLTGIFPCKGDSVGEIIRKIIFLTAVMVFAGAGVMLASTLVQSQRAQDDQNDIIEKVTTTVSSYVDTDGSIVTVPPTEEEIIAHNFDVIKFYKDINDEVRGFIELEGCNIYQPVVQAEDNDYYLTHTYYKGTNKAGSIFLDSRCRIEEDYVSPNLVIYGHNQEDGTMFGNLKDYKQDLDFYAANPTITFNTEYGIGTYLIYGYFVTSTLKNQDSNGEVFHYHDYIEVMNDETTFNWYMKEVMERNYIVSPVDVEFGDQLLCLSTCSNEFSNSRFVVFARKLRDGENVSDYDFTEAYFNPYAKGVDWEAIMSGETTAPTEETSDESISEESTDESETEESVTEVSESETEPETQVAETSETEEETTADSESESSDTEESSDTQDVASVTTTVIHTPSVVTTLPGNVVAEIE